MWNIDSFDSHFGDIIYLSRPSPSNERLKITDEAAKNIFLLRSILQLANVNGEASSFCVTPVSLGIFSKIDSYVSPKVKA